MSLEHLLDLDPFAIEPEARPVPTALPLRRPSPFEQDLLELDDPLSEHAAEEARKARQANVVPRSPPRRPPRRMSSSSRAMTVPPRRESIDAALFVPPSTPPASSVLSQFNARRPSVPKSHESSDSFSDFQTGSPGSSSPPGLLSNSLRSTWTALKTTSAHARPALATLFHDISSSSADDVRPSASYFSGAPGFGGEKHNNSWPGTPRSATPTESVRPPSIQLRGVREGLRATLSLDLAEAIRPSLPPRTRLASVWQLLYSLDQHGVSLSTMYRQVSPADAPCVLVLRDGEGHIFGAFVNQPLQRSESYYGSGECFLWSSTPFKPDDIRIGIGVRAFRWTGRNTYCMFSNDKYINIGGGDGKFGLYIDSAMAKGFSARCSTFDNDCLCTSTGRDEAECEIIAFEVWRITS